MSDQPLPYYPDCFVCGTTPTGLSLRFCRAEDGGIVARNIVFPAIFQGFPGILHGGVLSAALDECALWAASIKHGDYVVTQELTVKFKRPTRTDTAYTASARLIAHEGSKLTCEGELVDADGKLYASVQGVFRPMPAKMADGFEALVTYPENGSNAWRQPRHVPPPAAPAA